MTPRQGSIGNIVRNAGWMLGGKGFSALLSTVYLAILTRSLGVAGFGQFSLALGVAQAVELLVTFQSWQIVVRYGMPHLHAGRRGELAQLLWFTTLLDIATALLSAVIVVGAMLVLGREFGWSSEFIEQAMACGVLFVLSTHWTPIGVLRLYDFFAKATFADAMTPVTRLIGSVIVWLTGPSIIGFLTVWAIAEMVTAIAYWITALRKPGLSWRLERRLRWREIAEANPGIAAYAATTNLNSSLDVGGKQVAVLLIGLLLTPTAVGKFRLAQQLAQGLAKFSQTLARAIFPELVRSRTGDSEAGGNGGEQRHFEELLSRTVRLTAAGGVAAFLFVLVLGWPLLGLIGGPDFMRTSGYGVLLLLGTAAAIDIAAVGFEPALVTLGRPALALKLRVISTIVLLGGIALLTPMIKVVGAGVAGFLASLLSAVMLWYALRRLIGRLQPWRPRATPASEA